MRRPPLRLHTIAVAVTGSLTIAAPPYRLAPRHSSASLGGRAASPVAPAPPLLTPADSAAAMRALAQHLVGELSVADRGAVALYDGLGLSSENEPRDRRCDRAGAIRLIGFLRSALETVPDVGLAVVAPPRSASESDRLATVRSAAQRPILWSVGCASAAGDSLVLWVNRQMSYVPRPSTFSVRTTDYVLAPDVGRVGARPWRVVRASEPTLVDGIYDFAPLENIPAYARDAYARAMNRAGSNP